MSENADLIKKLYASLNRHDHQSMAECYHPDASFMDIAFKLEGKEKIHDMWAMICRPGSDLRVWLVEVGVDDNKGVATLVDTYSMSDTKNLVINPITSYFEFKDGLIHNHRDVCDPKQWSDQAFGGVMGLLAGNLRFLRSIAANNKLNKFKESQKSTL